MMENILRDWFTAQGWQPFPFQDEVWEAYLNGESGLIHSPTGTGKTYAAWLGSLMAWVADNPPPYKTRKRKETPPLTVLWITPLRALAADTAQALQAPLDTLGIPWSLETRTGDTSSTVRGRQRRRLPTALITTPESLSLLLSRENAHELFSDLRCVVVDEWHELMSTKRGVQTELGLARLRHWNPDLRLWGLSATMGNLDVAMRALLGMGDSETGEVKPGRLVRGDINKTIRIDSIIPNTIERFPWAGHLGTRLLPQVLRRVEEAHSTLIFTNTRAQTEIWYQAILDAKPEWAGSIALHHSSLDRKTRDWVEDSLRAGMLKCVVCTSSLDLGVDFSPVEQVLQVGSPKGIARLLQRAGRSGHQPDAVSRAISVPTHALELIEVAAARSAAEAGHIEARLPYENALDVLAQHLVTIGLGGGFDPAALYQEVKTTYAYRNLTQIEWEWTLDFVQRGGDALHAYEQYSRVKRESGHYSVDDKHIARLHRMSIGTIVSDASLQVKYLNGARIGYIEESFISRLKPGDKFTLGGKVLKFVRVRDMTVQVRRSSGGKGVVPRWYGGKLPLSDELTNAIREQLDMARRGIYASPEMLAVQPILELQAKWSAVPSGDTLLIEQVKTREGHHLFFYPFAGRLAHEGMAALFAWRIAQITPITFTLASNDYGFELLSPEPAPLEQALDDGLLSPVSLDHDILESLNAAEMGKRQFREIARVAGLVMERFPGGQKTTRQLQASSSLIYDVLMNYDADNLLLAQAQREVLERQLERDRLQTALGRLAAGKVDLREVKRPTPFAFPLLVDRLRQTVSSETLEDRIQKMVLQLEKAANR
jgi:ATP-dependent helicase Lhr and Lhr-like helicase